MADVFEKAADFITTNARLLERRIFDHRFLGQPVSGVLDALQAYQNPDGGLGHALEPDLRTQRSQPIFAEVGLKTLWEVDAKYEELVGPLCDFLARCASPEGLLPPVLQSGLESPRAAHWEGDFALKPSLLVTLGVCGLLHFQGVEHPWLTRVTEVCRRRLLESPPEESHMLLGATFYVSHAPGGAELFDPVAEAIPTSRFFIADAPASEYGLTPLHFAPSPDSPWVGLFTQQQLEAHLEDLLSRQQEDGGWPISWKAPGPAAELEWRGRTTLDALTTLIAYGAVRTPPDASPQSDAASLSAA